MSMGSKDGQVTERLVVVSRRCLGTMPGVTFEGRAFAQGESRALHRRKAYRQVNLMEIELLSRYILVSCHSDASTILKARTTKGRSKKPSTSLQNSVADAGPSQRGSFKVAS
jgi:hypothetical protein